MPALVTGLKPSSGVSCLWAQGESLSSSVSYERKERESTMGPEDGETELRSLWMDLPAQSIAVPQHHD